MKRAERATVTWWQSLGAVLGTLLVAGAALGMAEPWSNFALDPQHSAQSPNASQSLSQIHWQTPVDLDPQYSGSELLIHYGSPMVTAANTVIVPVKTGAQGGFEVEALQWNQRQPDLELADGLYSAAAQLDARVWASDEFGAATLFSRGGRHSLFSGFARLGRGDRRSDSSSTEVRTTQQIRVPTTRTS